jgi:BON domain
MIRISLWMSSLALVIILGLGVSCARKPDDGKISSEVQGKFSQDSGLSTKPLTVQASDGVVTLAGTVDNQAQREAAGRQAASVDGVRTVINNLQVANAAAAPTGVVQAPPLARSSKISSGKVAAAGKKPKSRNSDDSTSASSGPDSNGSQADATNQPPPAAVADNNAAPAITPAVDPPPPPPPPPSSPRKLIIDQGTQLTVRLIDPVDSEKNQTGDTFHATLNAPLSSDGQEAVPAGTELTGHLVSVKSAGKFAGQSEVVLQLDSISSGGQTYSLQTDQYKKTGSSRGKNTAEKVGGGAVLGSIIGAIAGGGKGAAIGGAAGAGVGGGVQAASKSQQIKLPSETVLNFSLQEPVTVVQATNPEANRQKLDSQ